LPLSNSSLTEKINLQHLIELREKFDKADLDHGGALELDEFVDAFGEVLGVGMSRKQLVQLFMRIDANSDGSIDWEEFMNYILLENESLSSMRAEHCEYVNPKVTDPISQRGPLHGDMITKLILYPPSQSSEHSRYLTSSRDGSVKVWNAQTNSLMTTILMGEKKHWVTSMEVLRRSERLAVGLSDRSIVFCDLMRPTDPSSKCIPVSRISDLQGVPTSMDYIEDRGRELLGVGDDKGHVSLYKFGEDWHICNIRMDCHKQEIERIQSDQLNVYETKRKKFVTKELRELPVMTHMKMNVDITERLIHSGWINKLQYISDLDGILTCSSDSTIKLIDLERVEERKVHKYHHKSVLAFAWCRDFKFIASCGEERNVVVWNPFSKNAAVNFLHGHNAAIVDIALNEEKSQLISLGVDKVIKIWDIRNYRCIQTIVDKTSYHPDNTLTSVHYDSRVCAILLTSRKINVWPFKAQEDMQTSHDSAVSAARFNRNFNSIISVDDESNVYVWDIEDGKLMFKYPDAHGKNRITAMTFDASMRRLITGGHDGSIKMWNFSNGHCLRDFLYDCEPKEISAITFVPDAKMSNVVTVGWDRNIYIWPDENEQVVYPAKILPKPGHTGHSDDIICVLYCSREKVLVTGAHNGEIIVWLYETGFEKAFLHEVDPTCLPAANAAQEGKSVESLHYFSPQEALISVCANGVVRFWDLQNVSLLLATRVKHLHKDCLSASALSPDCHYLATGDESGNLKLTDISAFDKRRPSEASLSEVFFLNIHSAIINCIDIFQPDEHPFPLIATCSFDRNVKLLTLDGRILGYFGQGRKWDLSADLSTLPVGPPPEHPTVYVGRRSRHHRMPDEENSDEEALSPLSPEEEHKHRFEEESDRRYDILKAARGGKFEYHPPNSFSELDTTGYTLEGVQDSAPKVLTHRTGLDLDDFKKKFGVK